VNILTTLRRKKRERKSEERQEGRRGREGGKEGAVKLVNSEFNYVSLALESVY
jgi:hypothetical protein